MAKFWSKSSWLRTIQIRMHRACCNPSKHQGKTQIKIHLLRAAADAPTEEQNVIIGKVSHFLFALLGFSSGPQHFSPV
jgi:hypothetical protein